MFFAKSVDELQQMLNAFSDFCDNYELTVNLDKSAVVVFSCSKDQVLANIFYRGSIVPLKSEYKYLGIIFRRKWGCKNGGQALLAAASKALFAIERYAKLQEITDSKIMCNLFDSLILPIITYGSEIWGSWESTGGFTLSNQCDKLYLGFLKRVTHVPSGTDS